MYEDIIKEAKSFSINLFNEGDKLMCKDWCDICGEGYTKEVTFHTNRKGFRIPRYCNTCVEDLGIVNENYVD